MYKIIGKIENFDKKKSYPQFGKAVATVAESARPSVSAVATVMAKASKHPADLLNEKICKRAKATWKKTNPNHKDKLLTKFSCN